MRHRGLLHLHVTLGLAVVLAAVSVSRIDGLPWSWLLLWEWGLMALLALAAIWTVTVAIGRRLPERARAAGATAGALGLIALIVRSSARFTTDAARYRLEAPEGSVVIRLLTPPTVQRAQQERLRSDIKAELDGLGLSAIGRLMDANLLLARFEVADLPRVPSSLRAKMNRLFESEQPAAVFLVPPAEV